MNQDLVPISSLARRAARLYGDKPALMVRKGKDYEKISFPQLAERVDLLADGLLVLGLSRGDKVGILGENRPEWAETYLAILRAGGVVVPLDPQHTEQELLHILDDSSARYVIVSMNYLPDINEVAHGLTGLEKIICMDQISENGMETLDELVRKAGEEELSKPEPSLDDLAVILYTSGTTELSKAVMLSHRNIVSNASSLCRAISFSTTDVFLSILPLHHTLEATCGFIVPLYGGCAVAYARSLKSREILEDIREAGASVILGVPLLYEKIFASILRGVRDKPFQVRAYFNACMGLTKSMKGLSGWNPGGVLFKSVRHKAGLTSIKYLICGGAPLPPEVGKGFVDLGFTFLQGYGLTEASPVLTVNRPDKNKPESIGLAIPDVELCLENPDAAGVGELVARGPNVMMGYYRNSQATTRALSEGWLHTGDLARRDKNGFYYIAGRMKNVIVSAAGMNIYPEEVEAQLIKSPFIAEVMVVGVLNPHTKREEVEAIVYPDTEALDAQAKSRKIILSREEVEKIIGEEIHKQCLSLAEYKRVKRFQLRFEAFPKTAIQKIKRYLVSGKARDVNRRAFYN